MRSSGEKRFEVLAAHCAGRTRDRLCLGGPASDDPMVAACVDGWTAEMAPTALLPLLSVSTGLIQTSALAVATRAYSSENVGSLPSAPEPTAEPSSARDRSKSPEELATAARLLRDVRLSSIAHLVKGSLRPLRSAITRTSEHAQPQCWAAYHVILGCALRLRSRNMRGTRRAAAVIEAIQAFEAAFGVYSSFQEAESARASSVVKRHAARAPCEAHPDGATLVAKVVDGRSSTDARLLERAVLLLREARVASADARSWEWISSTNNLACALTLLANRVEHSAACLLLEEAVEVLEEGLRAQSVKDPHDDRRCTLTNLSEALSSMAAREIPSQRMRHLESALQAAAEALAAVVPAAYAWLVQLEQLNLL